MEKLDIRLKVYENFAGDSDPWPVTKSLSSKLQQVCAWSSMEGDGWTRDGSNCEFTRTIGKGDIINLLRAANDICVPAPGLTIEFKVGDDLWFVRSRDASFKLSFDTTTELFSYDPLQYDTCSQVLVKVTKVRSDGTKVMFTLLTSAAAPISMLWENDAMEICASGSPRLQKAKITYGDGNEPKVFSAIMLGNGCTFKYNLSRLQ